MIIGSKKTKLFHCLILLISVFFITSCESEMEKEFKEKGCFSLDSKFVEIYGINPTYFYTGEPITPKPVISIKDIGTLEEGIGYSIDYENNIEIGKATVKIIGNKQDITLDKKVLGNVQFICSGQMTFDIVYNSDDSKSIDEVSVSGIDEVYEYTGSPITPVPTLKYGDTILSTDNYDLSYDNNTDVGIAKIIITGKGQFTGTKTIEFVILKKPIITCLNPVYNGSEQDIATCENGTWDNNENYKVKRINAGQYSVKCSSSQTINGVEKVAGVIKKCSISPIDISEAVITEQGNGDTVASRIVVSYDGNRLKNNTDYELTFNSSIENNTNYIKKIVISGIGNYTGSKEYSISMELLMKDISNAKIIIGTPQKYTGDHIKPKKDEAPSIVFVDENGNIIKKLREDVDYSITYHDSTNKNPGAAKITVTGKENYYGTLTGIGFYIYDDKCTKEAMSASFDKSMNIGVSEVVKDNQYKSYIKNNELWAELWPGESIKIKITIPAVCGEITRRDLSKNFDTIKGGKEYISVEYEDDMEKADDQVKHDEDGNVYYYMTITATNDEKKLNNFYNRPVDEKWIVVTTWRAYATHLFKNDNEKTINFGAKTHVTIVKKDEKKSDNIKKLYDCCCTDSSLSKCNWAPENGICDDDDDEYKYGASANKCGKYTCSFAYNEKTKKLEISAFVGNRPANELRTVSVKKTVINGVDATSVKPNGTLSFTGYAYFSDGNKSSKCEYHFKATPKPTVKPTVKPTAKPTVKPTAKPTATPSPTPKIERLCCCNVSDKQGCQFYDAVACPTGKYQADWNRCNSNTTTSSKPQLKQPCCDTRYNTTITSDYGCSTCTTCVAGLCPTEKPAVSGGSTSSTNQKKCCCAASYGKDCNWQDKCTGYYNYSYNYSQKECNNH